MSHAWNPPTYRDVTGNDLPVKCPQCRRPVAPDMLQPTAPLPGVVRRRGRKPEVDYMCDNCRETVVREGLISSADIARLLGAPEAHAAMVEAKTPSPARGRYGKGAV